MNLTDLISALYERSRLNKADFCEEMAISRQTLDNWLNRKKYPNAEDLTKIAKKLDVVVHVALDKEGVEEADYIRMSKRLTKCMDDLEEKEVQIQESKKKASIPATKPELKT